MRRALPQHGFALPHRPPLRAALLGFAQLMLELAMLSLLVAGIIAVSDAARGDRPVKLSNRVMPG